jgi:hypothetical protein
MSEESIKPGTTYRSKDKRDRITYDPGFSASRPWELFISGTAVNRFVFFGDAAHYAKVRYLSIIDRSALDSV